MKIIKNRIIEYMNSFEIEFFFKIKKMLSYYFKEDKRKYLKILKFKQENYNYEISNGNAKNMKEILEKIDNTNIQIALIDKMILSQNFESLIPYLKYYLKTIK
jgi:hypothetical protein